MISEASDARGKAITWVSDHRAQTPGKSTTIYSVKYGWQNSSPWERSEVSYIKQLLLALLPFLHDLIAWKRLTYGQVKLENSC